MAAPHAVRRPPERSDMDWVFIRAAPLRYSPIDTRPRDPGLHHGRKKEKA